MQWLNEPAHWSESDNQIVVKTDPKTDFWRITHYGFIRDNGHFYFDTIDADFDVEVTVRGAYKDLYDQAGIMIRSDDTHWIKTGIEYVHEIVNLSTVVTNTYSDWSVTPLTAIPDTLQFRVERRKEALQVFYLNKSSQYSMLRMAYLPTSKPLQVGIMAASPDGDGYEVVFEDYRLTPVA